MKKKKTKENNKIKLFFDLIFKRHLSFEEGVDITSDVNVLNRRNFVIKNLVFISNFLYAIILLGISIFDPKTTSNWVFTILTVPITFLVNKLLKKLILDDPNDLTKQKVAMYVASFYTFFTAVLIYARIAHVGLETGGYILILYSLVIISLYQDKKLLSGSFLYLLISITIVHLIITYDLYAYPIDEFFTGFVKSSKFSDIILRTAVFIVFFLVLFSITSIGQFMQEERKKELVKRKLVQDDFINTVGDLFSVVFSSAAIILEEKKAYMVLEIAKRILTHYGKEIDKDKLEYFALIHLDQKRIKVLKEISKKPEQFGYDELKVNSGIGALIAKRIEIAQKCEMIVRSFLEETANSDFIKEVNSTQPEIMSQILLLSDMYITMRRATSYKRPMVHQLVMKAFNDSLYQYFETDLIRVFLTFNNDFEEIYNNF